MNVTAKIARSCLQHINVKYSSALASGHFLQTPFKRTFSSQHLFHPSSLVLNHEQKYIKQKGNFVVGSMNHHELSVGVSQHELSVGVSQFSKSSSSIAGKPEIQKNVSALQVKKRVPRKKSTLDLEQTGKDKWLVVAYSSAEEYDLPAASREIKKQGIYKILSLPEDAGEVLHVSANYQVGKEPRHIYFFSEGCVVFWNVPDLEQQSVLEFMLPFEINAYNEHIYKEEKEDLEYCYAENGPKLSSGLIVLHEDKDTESLETYAFSNGMALSVKLALWEATLESFVDSIEWVTENMKYGKKVKMSREQVFQKRGELFALRHVINLSSDLLDTPDFYWDRHDLEILYQQTYNHLNISKRTKVMNERLNYCSELIDLLGNHMNDKHHVRLELMIIALIMVEVMFECVHFISRAFQE